MAKKAELKEESKILDITRASRAKAFLAKYSKNEFASTLETSKLSNVQEWISSGSYSFNKVLSGSYYKGFANNRLYVLAGPSSTGKSLMCVRLVREAQRKGYQVFYFDSENAIDNAFMERFGIDTASIIYIPVKTISEFRNEAVKMMRNWREDEETKNLPAIFFCDSIGGLMGTKELNDVAEDKSASDMGQRAKELRAAARILTIECAHNSIPMVVTNHTYEQAAANPQAAPVTKMAGGEGFMYAASVVVYLKKKQIREEEKNALGDNVKKRTGNIIVASVEKNRFVPEGTKAEIYMDFEKGLQPYYGLLEDAVHHGFFDLSGKMYYVKHLDKKFFETKIYGKDIWEPILKDLNEKVEASFKFATIIEDEAAFDDAQDGKIE